MRALGRSDPPDVLVGGGGDEAGGDVAFELRGDVARDGVDKIRCTDCGVGGSDGSGGTGNGCCKSWKSARFI